MMPTAPACHDVLPAPRRRFARRTRSAAPVVTPYVDVVRPRTSEEDLRRQVERELLDLAQA